MMRRLPRSLSSCRCAVDSNCRGYSLVELLIVVTIIATIAAIAVPSYLEMVNSAHIVAAIGDIKRIQFDIECYVASNGLLPDSLEEAQISTPLDPWGRPYQYLKIAGAETAGGNDNSATNEKENEKDPGKDTGKGKGKDVIKADGQDGGKSGETNNGGVNGARKDKNLHPLNSDYDLYSKGRDGISQLPITAKPSRDDILRANNGGFVGLAATY